MAAPTPPGEILVTIISGDVVLVAAPALDHDSFRFREVQRRKWNSHLDKLPVGKKVSDRVIRRFALLATIPGAFPNGGSGFLPLGAAIKMLKLFPNWQRFSLPGTGYQSHLVKMLVGGYT